MKKFELRRDGWGFWQLRRRYGWFIAWHISCESCDYKVIEWYLRKVQGEIS